MSHISYETFKSLDIRVGTIRFVEPVPDSDKLYRCLVDFGEELKTDVYTDPAGNIFPVRQIVSGIRGYYPDPAELIGRQVLYCVNLEPRTIKGATSHGMLMAAGENDCVFLSPSKPVPPGSQIH
jgi:methionyl-tRNA synthetase